MKGLEKVLLVAIFVVPVVVCTIVLRNIWSDDTEENKDSEKNGDSIIVDISDPYIDSGSQGQEDEESGEILQMGGESFENKLGDPISKIYEDATISAAVTNVYSESKETSEIVGKLEKYTTVTAQKFEQGWSRVTGIDASGIKISGWTKTINVSLLPYGSWQLSRLFARRACENQKIFLCIATSFSLFMVRKISRSTSCSSKSIITPL